MIKVVIVQYSNIRATFPKRSFALLFSKEVLRYFSQKKFCATFPKRSFALLFSKEVLRYFSQKKFCATFPKRSFALLFPKVALETITFNQNNVNILHYFGYYFTNNIFMKDIGYVIFNVYIYMNKIENKTLK